jgi:hypothetical protein
MPEQLSKHPEVTLEVLRSAGAACGTGAPQEILKTCPAERFCKLPGGEVCVYGLPQATQMTQITAADWRAVMGAAPSAPPAPAGPEASLLLPVGGALLAGLVLGIASGWLVWRVREKRA